LLYNCLPDCQEAFECGVQVSGVYTLRDPDTSMYTVSLTVNMAGL